MQDELRTLAERRAAEAEDLAAFSGVKLLHIRRQISELLSLIGRGDIFDQYTRHDISHIDEMLRILDWLVPDATQREMSPADWLLLVLSVYLHDLGMLVTKSEFEARAGSGFDQFCRDFLYAGSAGQDYRARVEAAYPEPATRERFLYQEFVRHTHAHRIRAWISGEAPPHLGMADSAASAIRELLGALDEKFRRELALVCESHHLDDLSDTKKYRTSQPFGNTSRETANVQYVAVLLRTADLLHITRDRTPSIVFRTISPTDPISQREWSKQMAVRAVRPQPSVAPEDGVEPTGVTDTIEVHALFTDAEGFFGLTAYLGFADTQLRQSYAWIDNARRKDALPHRFPWQRIDGSNIEASGFLPKPFAFVLDQARILDLLTGHTIYNDTDVVVRELIQNALDAVRLQAASDGDAADDGPSGIVQVRWDPSDRVLSVRDNGTGMTQHMVENHLLRVGSSRYQDPEFRRQYPNFSPVSRFGIGVLSCFMVADEVDVYTCHPDEPEARHISLRSVHGKYLIRLLSKSNDPSVAPLCPHGTEIRLRVRPSADVGDILETVRKWIVVPRARVEVRISDADPVPVGFTSPARALADALSRLGYAVQETTATIPLSAPLAPATKGETVRVSVVERQLGAVTIAYAVHWSEHFRDWTFLDIGSRHKAVAQERYGGANIGTCIEGIRVEFDTPGFTGIGVAALVNATGPGAPKTNVARSSIETTPEHTELLRSVYLAYAGHVAAELTALHEQRSFSLSWAADEAGYLIGPLLASSSGTAQPQRRTLLYEQLSGLPILIVEQDGTRSSAAPLQLQRTDAFWTSESALVRNAELLVKELPGSASVVTLLQALDSGDLHLPRGVLLSSLTRSSPVTDVAFQGKEVTRIVVSRAQRRVDLQWSARATPPCWGRLPAETARKFAALARRREFGDDYDYGGYDRSATLPLIVGRRSIETEGLEDEIGIRTRRGVFVVYGSELASYLSNWIDRLRGPLAETDELLGAAAFEFVGSSLSRTRARPPEAEEVHRFIGRVHPRLMEHPEIRELTDVLARANWRAFDPWAWTRPSPQGGQ